MAKQFDEREVWTHTGRQPHHHLDANGVLRKCWHECRSLLVTWQFWIGVTLSFPIEHFLWERVPPFSYIARLIGM